jgi:cell surface protein SprA
LKVIRDHLKKALFGLVLLICSFSSYDAFSASSLYHQVEDSTSKDSLKYPLRDFKPHQPANKQFDFKDPKSFGSKVVYDPITNTYKTQKTVGSSEIGAPKYQSFRDFSNSQLREQQREYFRQKAQATNIIRGSKLLPDLHFDADIVDEILSGGLIDIRPSGSAEVLFGGNWQRNENPIFSARQQRTGNFDFKLKMQFNVTGTIGKYIKVNTNYNTEATFEFENITKLNWEGKETDILKSIELGNVSLPLNGSLIQGGQSLFGIKTALQFGRLTVTTIATQQKGESRTTQVDGGAQVTQFNIQAHEYDVNRHYFLSQYFANTYDRALETLPVIQSNVIINYVEVWVTNKSSNYTNTGNLIAMMDLGERYPHNQQAWTGIGIDSLPTNDANDLFGSVKTDGSLYNTNTIVNTFNQNYPQKNMRVGTDYDVLLNARQLNPQEFTINSRLGYISLNQALNADEMLAVSFEYTHNGVIYKVGEFARDNPPIQGSRNIGTLMVKMLKSNLIKTNLPIWNLMMKNIYSLGSYNMETNDFNFNVVYADDKGAGDIGYLPVDASEGKLFERSLNQVFKLDRMNRLNEAKPDGLFDLIEGVTIQSQKGRIIFPMREPFGEFLTEQISNPKLKDRYVFNTLYDSTKWDAEQDVLHNKFFLRGSYKGSSSNTIRLKCFNVPQGSVKVTANGAILNEGSDYIVDYTIGTVSIINEGILSSGSVINATCESNSLFNIQQKTLIGSRFDFKYSDKLFLGATVLNLSERPLTPKTNIGEEPLLNTIWGVDGSYKTDSRFLTKMVDKIPLIETKVKSNVALNWEFAHIIAHKPRSIGDIERGTSFLDDFESAETPYDLKFYNKWRIASTPQHQIDLFPNATSDPILEMNRRANISWYTIQTLYQQQDRFTPDHLTPIQMSDHFVRTIQQDEVFPERQIPQATPTTVPTFDIAYYPKEKGPNNLAVKSVDANGNLVDPENSWAGISRPIETNDFEAANIEYLEIWLMDPFVYEDENPADPNTGQLYINLGSISEDIIPDGSFSQEQGLGLNGDTSIPTKYARVPRIPVLIGAFDNQSGARQRQDVGYDGMNDDEERVFYAKYLEDLKNEHGAVSTVYVDAFDDPSGDNYTFHRDGRYDIEKAPILERYKYINRSQGNATLDKLSDETPKAAYNTPDEEDLNGDHTSNVTEEYYQYKINLSQEDLVIGKGYVADAVTVFANRLDQGAKPDSVTYYQLKIPIRSFDKRVGNIQNFKSIRFMRMFLTGFKDSVVMRFIEMQMIRADWRRYLSSLKYPPTIGPSPSPADDTEFVISTVNVEENSSRKPIRYVEPPEIARELDPTQPNTVLQNEQSLSLRVCNLEKGDARGAFKVTELDIRNYKTIKMYLHAEGEGNEDGEVWAFMRLGTDMEQNYYQYEMPLKITETGSFLKSDIWPVENYLEVDLQKFYDIKLERNNVKGDNVSEYIQTLPNGHRIRVVGLPDLSQVRSMLLGVMNPTENPNPEPVCAEVWFNELRVTGLSNRGGYAATARMVANLADFAKINVTGNYSSIGFGGINKSLSERALEENIQYDISSNIELGKFFPKASGVTIPLFIGWNENIINPKYYPLNPDILFNQAVKFARNNEEKTQIREASQDYTSRYSLNLTNVKKNRTGASKAQIWDIENFNSSYSFQKVFRRNQIVEANNILTHRASLGYNFSNRAKPWEPFKKVIKSNKLRIIKDFNLNPIPNTLTARVDLDRRYATLKNRSNDNFKAIVPVFYDKSFTMKRTYGLRWNLARSLKINYNSVADAWIEEPIDAIDTEEERDTIRQNLYRLGTMSSFNQTVNANYTVPFNKIRKLSWIRASAKYQANYQWLTAPPIYDEIGNTIQNSRTINLNTSLNFTSFYNQFKRLRMINSNRPIKKKSTKDEDDPKNPNAKKSKQPSVSPVGRSIGRFLMMMKQVQLSVTQTNGITLPGFTEDIQYLGQNFNVNAPGLPFIIGLQDDQIRYDLATNGFLSSSELQNNRFLQLSSINYNGKATLEPIKNFRITLNYQQRESKTVSSTFRYDEATQEFIDQGLQEVGMFSTTWFSWSTAFDKVQSDYSTATFEAFKSGRFDIASRLQIQEFATEENSRFASRTGEIDDSTGFPMGFNKTHSEVMMLSFLSAYSGGDAKNFSLNAFKVIPIPSWRISYNGLKKLFGLDKIFSNINLTHAYSSTLNMNSYVSSLNYGVDPLLEKVNLATEKNFQQGLSLIERLTPVIGVDITMKNGLTLKFEYKRDRNVTLYMHTFQMIEQRNKEFVFGGGFRAGQIRLPIKYRGDRIYLENDINFRFDLSIRDGITIRRDIEQGTNTAQAGMRMISIKPTIDYKINDRMNFRAFYNRNINEPKTSQSFLTSLTDFGFSLRYTIQ